MKVGIVAMPLSYWVALLAETRPYGYPDEESFQQAKRLATTLIHGLLGAEIKHVTCSNVTWHFYPSRRHLGRYRLYLRCDCGENLAKVDNLEPELLRVNDPDEAFFNPIPEFPTTIN